MVQHGPQDRGALRQPGLVSRVHHKNKPVNFMVVLGPDATEALAATKIIYGHMVALKQWSVRPVFLGISFIGQSLCLSLLCLKTLEGHSEVVRSCFALFVIN